MKALEIFQVVPSSLGGGRLTTCPPFARKRYLEASGAAGQRGGRVPSHPRRVQREGRGRASSCCPCRIPPAATRSYVRIVVSLNSRLESNKEEEDAVAHACVQGFRFQGAGCEVCAEAGRDVDVIRVVMRVGALSWCGMPSCFYLSHALALSLSPSLPPSLSHALSLSLARSLSAATCIWPYT